MTQNLGTFKPMNKAITILKDLAKGNVKGVPIFTLAFVIILGFSMLAAAPLLLVFGLKLMGLPVVVSFKSWLGSVLIMAFLGIRIGRSNNG